MNSIILAGTVISILLGWWALKPSFFPSPVDVARELPILIQDGLLYQVFLSISTNIKAIGFTCLLIFPLAYLSTIPLFRPFLQFIAKLRFLGMTGLVIPFTLMFGGDGGLKVSLLMFGLGTFLTTSFLDIIVNTSRDDFDYVRTLRMGPWRSIIEVIVFGKFDAFLDAVRQNAAMGWVMLTMVEGLVRSQGGLGAMMLAEDKHMKLEAVVAIQIIVLIIGIIQDKLILALKNILCPYASLSLEYKT